MSEIVLFAVFPYVAVVVAVFGGVYRYRRDRFSYSTLSSQLLENRTLFWGSVPWHYGIVIVLLAHLLGFLMPGMWMSITAAPSALYTIEVIGFAFGLAALVGLASAGPALADPLPADVAAMIRAAAKSPADWM